MRALVTGGSGFVGRHLIAALADAGAEVVAYGGPGDDGMSALDLADEAGLRTALEETRPTCVFHLAAQAFVPESVSAPLQTYDINVAGTARLSNALREWQSREGTRARLLFISSAEVYGEHAPADFPLDESAVPRPENPYAASKLAAETLLLAEARAFGLDVVIARAFNHIGPGQNPRFVVAGMAQQLAHIASGARVPLLVGNLTVARDFLDVRDVVAAYVALARDGESRGVYNVCSGQAVRLRDLLGELIRLAHVPVEVREDPARMRALDVPLFVGNNAALRARTGWAPRVARERSLRDIYQAALEREKAVERA